MKKFAAYFLLAVMLLGAVAPAALAAEETTEAAEETTEAVEETTEAAEETTEAAEEATEATEETTEAETVPDLDATSGKCGDNLTWSFEDGTLTVSGSGEMETSAPWGRYRDDIQKLVLTGGVTTVAEEAFKDCDSLKEIDFGTSLKEIGVQAFYSCDSLESIRLPQSFKLFGAESFRDCSELTEIFCQGTMPSFRGNCLWNGNTITIYTPLNNPWPQGAVEELVDNFGGRIQILTTGGENLYIYTEPTEEPAEIPTTEPVTEPITEPVTEPTEAPTTAPTEESTEEPTTVPTEVPTEAPATEPFAIATEPAPPENNDLNGRSWIGLALIAGVVTLLVIGALIVRINSRKGGRYSE